MAGREVLERHKGMVLGVAWNVLTPIIQLVIFTFVFGYIFRSRWERGGLPPSLDFPLTYFAGQTFFQVFAEAAGRGPMLVSSRPNLVRRVVFPLEILPVTAVVASLVQVVISVAILLVAVAVVTGRVPVSAVYLPVVLVPLVMLALGVAWALAGVGVFVRDLRQIMMVVVLVVQFATPLFYQVERIPEEFRVVRAVIEYNPLSVIIENGRRALLWGEPLQWGALGWVTLASAGIMLAGYTMFMTLRRHLADVH